MGDARTLVHKTPLDREANLNSIWRNEKEKRPRLERTQDALQVASIEDSPGAFPLPRTYRPWPDGLPPAEVRSLLDDRPVLLRGLLTRTLRSDTTLRGRFVFGLRLVARNALGGRLVARSKSSRSAIRSVDAGAGSAE